MTIQISMFLLTVCAVLTSLITEAIKKSFTIKSSNIVALITSIFVGSLVPIGYLIGNKLPITLQDVVYIVAMVVLTWLCATLGYDKIIQAINQLINGGVKTKATEEDKNKGGTL